MLVWEGADAKTSRIFYVTMVQNVLLFASDMWMLLYRKAKYIEGFYNQASGRISIRVPWRHSNSI